MVFKFWRPSPSTCGLLGTPSSEGPALEINVLHTLLISDSETTQTFLLQHTVHGNSLPHTTTTAVGQQVHPLSSFTQHNYCSRSTRPSPLIFHTPQLLQSVNSSIPSHLSHSTTTAVCQHVHPLSSFTHHNYCSLSTGPSSLIFHTQLLQSVNRSIPSHLSHTTTTAVCQQVHPLSSFTHHNYCSLSTGPYFL